MDGIVTLGRGCFMSVAMICRDVEVGVRGTGVAERPASVVGDICVLVGKPPVALAKMRMPGSGVVSGTRGITIVMNNTVNNSVTTLIGILKTCQTRANRQRM